jgi:hypothetical protein
MVSRIPWTGASLDRIFSGWLTIEATVMLAAARNLLRLCDLGMGVLSLQLEQKTPLSAYDALRQPDCIMLV